MGCENVLSFAMVLPKPWRDFFLTFGSGFFFSLTGLVYPAVNGDLIIPANGLTENSNTIGQRSPALKSYINSLINVANSTLTNALKSVMTKPGVGPSGDKHDYLSLSTYYWPNPATLDGLPFIARDGYANPTNDYFDTPQLMAMCENVQRWALAYQFTGQEKYALRAVEQLRTWFIDPVTKMNPNMKYAQIKTGISTEGSPSGIIDSRRMILLGDAITLIKRSPHWTSQDSAGLASWFTNYVNWLQTNAVAKSESNANNNHALWYDVQVSAFSLYFTFNTNLAKRFLTATKVRLNSQIEADGSMPLELTRVDGLTYALFGLEALCNLGYLGSLAGVDLWSYQTPQGSGIRKAIDWMVPYATGKKTWNYNQETAATNYDAMVSTLRLAANAYQASGYEAALSNMVDVDSEKLRVNLYWTSVITNQVVLLSPLKLNQVQIELKLGQRALKLTGYLKSTGNTNYSVRYFYCESGLNDWLSIPESQLQGGSLSHLSGTQFTNEWVLPKSFEFEKKIDLKTEVVSTEGLSETFTNVAMALSDLYESGTDFKNIVCLNNVCSQTSGEGIVLINLPELQTAEVYRVNGALVRELTINNGTGRIQWNLKDKSNQQVSTGIFLIKLSGVGGQTTIKCALRP